MRCKAAVLHEYGKPLSIEEIEVEPPRGREVLVKIVAAGICHSDLHSIHGLYDDPIPAVLGHEGAGVVVGIGADVGGLSIGDHVVLCWKPACGECRPCRRGRPNLCEGNGWIGSGRMKDGTSRYSCAGREILQYAGTSTFAEYTVVEDVCAVAIDASLPLSAMSLIGCAVTTGAGAAMNAASIRRGDNIAVIGCGGVGLSAIQGAKIREAERIIAIDRSDEALRMALQMGATDVVNSTSSDVVTAIEAITGGGVDFSFEAVGRKETMELAASILTRGGEAVLIGVARPDAKVEVAPFILVRREHVVRGSFYGSAAPIDSFRQFASYYREDKLDLDSMVTLRRLEEINDVFSEMERGVAGRNVIVFD